MKKITYIFVLILSIICSCNHKQETNYSIKVHYQYIVFKPNNLNTFNVYVEMFLKLKNNTKDTLIVPYKRIKNYLKMIYKSVDSISLISMLNSDIKIAPLDSIDLNCAAITNDTIKEIPSIVYREDYKIYDNLSKRYLSYSNNYSIIRTIRFGVFKEKYLYSK